MLGEQLSDALISVPRLDWDRGLAATLRGQIAYMLAEFDCPDGLPTNPVGMTSFIDFIVRIILRA